MLRYVFTTQHQRLAIAFDGGAVLEVGPSDSDDAFKKQWMAADGGVTNVIDLAYSSDASLLVVATDDKHLRLHSTTRSEGDVAEGGCDGRRAVLSKRSIPKKPTKVLFAPTPGGKEVLVVSDKCGDAYASPLPDPASALKHLLGHTAMTITSMASLRDGELLATGDRAEHIRISEFPRTSIVQTYLLAHEDFVSVLAAVPGRRGTLLVSGGGDGRVGLWDAECGENLSMVDVRQACGALAEGDDASRDRPDPSPDPLKVAGADAAAVGEEVHGAGEGMGKEASGAGASGEATRAGGSGDPPCVGSAARDAGDGEANTEADEQEDIEDPQGGLGDGIPISIACSGDGSTVAVVVTGLAGLLLLKVSYGMETGDGAAEGRTKCSLAPLARLELPTEPIQAGFLEGTLVVALPSPHPCLRSFRSTASPNDATEFEAEEEGVGSTAARVCAVVNAAAREQGLVLKAAVPDRGAGEELAGALRKHRGSKNDNRSPDGWNNFSKRRDKKLERKKRRTWRHADGEGGATAVLAKT